MRRITPIDQTAGKHESPKDIVDTHAVVIRNYDGRDGHELSVKFLDDAGKVMFNRTCAIDPLDTVAVRPHVKTDTYRVTVECDGRRMTSGKCLIGSPVREAALIEVGNGVISLTDGIVLKPSVGDRFQRPC